MSTPTPRFDPHNLPDLEPGWRYAVGYARLSLQDGASESTATQVRKITKYATDHQLLLLDVFVDDGISAFGGKPRAGWDATKAALLTGIPSVLIARAADRLARDAEEGARTVRAMPKSLVVETYNGGTYNLAAAYGRQQLQTGIVNAEFDSAARGESVADRWEARAIEEGRAVAGTRPFGWAWRRPCPGGEDCEHPTKKDGSGRCTVAGRRPEYLSRHGLVRHPTEAPMLAEIYADVAAGGSLAAACRKLTAAGFTGTSGARFTGTAVGAMLRQARHAGKVSLHGSIVADLEGAEPIVELELWTRVQRILSNPERRTSPGRSARTPLSGIARCGVCGGPMNASRKHRNGSSYPTYICARGGHVAKARKRIDPRVLGLLEQTVIDHAVELGRLSVAGASPAQLQAAAEVEKLQARLEEISDQIADGVLPADVGGRAATRVKAVLADAEDLAVVASGRPAVARLTASEDVAATWAELVAAEDPEPLRLVIRELLTEVSIHRQHRRGVDSPEDVQVVWAPWVAPLLGDAGATG